MLEGRLVLDTAEGSLQLGPGDYGLVPVGLAHAARNPGCLRRQALLLAGSV